MLSLVGTTIGRHHNPQRPVAAVKPENLCVQRSPNPLNLGREAKPSPYQKYEQEGLDYKHIVAMRHARAKEIKNDYLRFMYLLLAEKMDDPLLKQAYLQAAK